MAESYLCACCNTDEKVKIRYHEGKEYGSYCSKCWRSVKNDIGKPCQECGSTRAERVTIQCGYSVMTGIFCHTCGQEFVYDNLM